MIEDRTLRAADEIEAVIRLHGFALGSADDLFDAFAIAVQRTLGQSAQTLAKREEYRLLREIHQAVCGGTTMDR